MGPVLDEAGAAATQAADDGYVARTRHVARDVAPLSDASGTLMRMSDEPQDQASDSASLERGLASDLAIAVSAGAAGGAASGTFSALVDNVLNRPPAEQPPEIVLPPGVSKD